MGKALGFEFRDLPEHMKLAHMPTDTGQLRLGVDRGMKTLLRCLSLYLSLVK